jgi:two-component system response regulator HydG
MLSAEPTSPTAAPPILVVEDDPETRELVAGMLRNKQYDVVAVADANEAIEALRRPDPRVSAVLTDVDLGRGATGLDLCQKVAEIQPDLPVIVLTASGNYDTAVAAIRAGAYDFIAKPIASEALLIALQRAVSHRQLRGELRRLRDVVEHGGIEGLLGESPVMKQVGELIGQVAEGDASVLITGESGTGKEVVARAIHARSGRHDRPFVAVDCAAVPAGLIESELFGHVKGAFTDAKSDRPGLLVQADGGTLFLDELGELPLEVQAKLLRVLQERTVRPVGGEVEVPFDTRLICATNRDLELAVAAGKFRADLFYRVNVVHLNLPPLRDRRGDVLLLAQHFLERFAERTGKPVVAFSGPAAQRLLDYAWPGNVRELENCVERAVTLTRGSEIAVDDLPEKVREHVTTRFEPAGDDPKELLPLSEIEQRYIRRVLAAVHGNKTHAARILGLDRRSLYRRLDKSRQQQGGGDAGNGASGNGHGNGHGDGGAPPSVS